ncbi:MAG TPA: response regulator transcription factor [Desulfobulbaceae bacterium]|nr:response regulator transcription factor [Desulfobulbaceae bacterium]
MITAFLADDHQMFRQGLRTLLSSTKDIQVIGEASDGQESLRLIEELQPEVAVLDIAMPGLTGIEVARRLARVAPQTKNLILTMHADCFYAVEALKANALGFMLKEESFDMLIDAIRAVAAGNMFVSPTLEKPVLKEFVGLAKQTGGGSGNILTEREREILQLVVEGLTNQEISKKLCISTSTVDTHRKNIMAKLDIHSIAGLVKYAIRHKIVTL